MTCPLSPFPAAQSEPTAPQHGQSHPDGKGMHSNVLWVQPLCSFLCISLGDPLYHIHGSAKVESTRGQLPRVDPCSVHMASLLLHHMEELACCESSKSGHVQNGIRSLVVCFADIFHYYLLGLTSIVSAEKKTRGVLTLDQII